MVSNFDFLKKDFPVLSNFGKMAEKYCYSDSNSCLMKLGMIGETIVNLMFTYDRIAFPQDNTAVARIDTLSREGLLGLTYRPADIEPDGTIVLRSSNIVNDEIDLNDLVRVKTKIRENQYVQPNDILICARNGSKALVGKCALVNNLKEPTSFGAFMAIYRTNYNKYVIHYLHTSLFRSVFNAGNSTAINQLTQDMLKKALIPFPPILEQEKIVNVVSKLFIHLHGIEKSLN